MSESRLQISNELKVGEGMLRRWEECGLLPVFDSIPAKIYRDRAILILAARGSMSMQRLRVALAAGGC